MNILLINSPTRIYRDPEFFPYGLSLLASIIKKRKNHVYIYDFMLDPSIEHFKHFLKNSEIWDIIAITGLITTYGFQLNLADSIKVISPRSKIISGGGLASSVPDILLSHSQIDIACIGEGESTIDNIINSISSGICDFSQIPGIAWKDGEEIILNPADVLISNLDDIPFPDWEIGRLKNYFKYSIFFNKGFQSRQFKKRADTLTSRGCNHQCSFCNSVFPKGKIRIRSISNVIEEIKELKIRYSVDSIDFLDEDFCFSRDRVVEFCNEVLENELNISWGTATRVDNIDRDLLKLMKKSGCVFLLYGFESGSQTILDQMNKNTRVEQLWETFTITEEEGIDSHGNIIIGHPGENLKTLEESLIFQTKRFNYLYHNLSKNGSFGADSELLKRKFNTVSFCTPYPGTKIFNKFKNVINIEQFLSKITCRDAKDLVINLTDLPDCLLLEYQQKISNPEILND